MMAVCVLLLSLAAEITNAQKMSLSTDLLGYAELGTLNVDASYALDRKWSITAGARYNPFTYHKGDEDEQFQYRQLSYSLGARLWPWHTWSGWWFAGKLRYQEYNHGGILSKEAREGDRAGVGLYAGYTYMLSKHFKNVAFLLECCSRQCESFAVNRFAHRDMIPFPKKDFATADIRLSL